MVRSFTLEAVGFGSLDFGLQQKAPAKPENNPFDFPIGAFEFPDAGRLVLVSFTVATEFEALADEIGIDAIGTAVSVDSELRINVGYTYFCLSFI